MGTKRPARMVESDSTRTFPASNSPTLTLAGLQKPLPFSVSSCSSPARPLFGLTERSAISPWAQAGTIIRASIDSSANRHLRRNKRSPFIGFPLWSVFGASQLKYTPCAGRKQKSPKKTRPACTLLVRGPWSCDDSLALGHTRLERAYGKGFAFPCSFSPAAGNCVRC